MLARPQIPQDDVTVLILQCSAGSNNAPSLSAISTIFSPTSTFCICSVEDSQLQHIQETEGLSFSEENDKILDKDGNTFDARTPVSMNLWCFDSSMIDLLKLQWEKFLESYSQSISAECLLPSCVAQIMESDDYEVEVVASSSTWTGITNPEDLAKVKRNIIGLRGK